MQSLSLARGGRLARVAALVVIAVLAASCSRTASNGSEDAAGGTTTSTLTKTTEREAGRPPQPGGQLTVALAAETDSFSPYGGAWSTSAYEVASAIYDPLAAIDDKGVSHPYLAEDILPNEDFTQWTIKLRSGIKFHNGEPLDAAAVKKNLDAARKGVLTSQALTALQDVTVLDPTAVMVKMSRPWSTFPAALSVQTGFMAAPAMLDDPAGSAASPIGTGPFVFQNRQRDAFVNTKRNPDYWRKADDGTPLPYLDAVVFKVLPDASSRRSALAAGDVDAAMTNTPEGLNAAIKAAANGETQLLTDADQETDETVLGLNTTRLPFSDPLARQALAYGIDQQALASTVYAGIYPGAWGMFEQSSPYYIPKQDAGYPEHDVNKARELAQQYQAAHGTPLEFSTLLPPDPQFLAIGQAFQAQAAEFGVKVNVQAIEQTQLVSRVIVAGDYEASWFVLWSSPSPDRSYIFLALPPNPTGLSLNFSRFDDPTIRDALDRFRSTTNQQTRFDTIRTEQQSLAKNLQVLFIVHNHAGFEYNNHTHGFRSTLFAGTDRQAYSPYVTTPFLTNVWKEQK